jgi:hypothetical protein
MPDPVKYGQHPPILPETACEGCGENPASQTDHCHQHGWVRGQVCRGCNTWMGLIDRRVAPQVDLATLLVLQHRCPECDQLSISDLAVTKTKTLYLRVDDTLFDRIYQLAADEDRTITAQAVRLLTAALDYHDEVMRDAPAADRA